MQDAVKVLAAVKSLAAVLGDYVRHSAALGLLHFECWWLAETYTSFSLRMAALKLMCG